LESIVNAKLTKAVQRWLGSCNHYRKSLQTLVDRDCNPMPTSSVRLFRLALILGVIQSLPVTAASQDATAHIWVSTTGGACTRSTTPLPYDANTACGSLAAAYAAANASSDQSLILIKSGRYSEQHIRGHRTSSSRITFRPAPGESPVFAGKIRLGDYASWNFGPDYLTFEDITTADVGSGYETPENRWGIYIFGGSDNLEFRRIRAGSIAIYGAQNVGVYDSTFGPCRASKIDNIPGSGPCTINYIDFGDGRQAKNILYDNVKFFGFNYAQSCVSAGDCHYRAMYMNGVDGVTIRRSAFWQNVFEPWFTHSGSDAAAAGNRRILIEQNYFGASVQSPSGSRGGPSFAWCQNYRGGSVTYDDVVIRFNSLARGVSIAVPASNSPEESSCRIGSFSVYGNLQGARHPGCKNHPAVQYSYNVYAGSTSGTCGPGDVNIGGTTMPFYANDTATPSVDGDYALTGGLMAADNLVPATLGCPATDRQGVARPQDAGFCDAGAHERAGGTTTPPPAAPAPAPPTNIRIVASGADEGPTILGDSFDRSDAPTLGANWANQTSASIGVSASQAVAAGGAAFHCAYWNGGAVNPDQFAQVVVRSVSANNRYVFATVRSSGTTDAARSHYYVGTDGTAGAGHLELNRVINGTITGIASFNATFAAGDVLRLEAQGTRLRVFRNGIQLGTDYTDSSLPSGQPGMCLFGTGAAADDWAAGALGGT
jgi:hypothetical protein